MNLILRDMLERHEGKRNKPYRCTAGKLTIGIGHNIDANSLPNEMQDFLNENGFITDEMIDELLDEDVAVATAYCEKLYPLFDTFSDNRQMALIDFIFNVGYGTAKTFVNTNKAINDERWEDAADNFEKSLWYKQVKGRAKEIVEMIRYG